jgi:hypothetical protein
MKRILILILAIMTVYGCDKTEEQNNNYNLDIVMEFSVFNTNDQDLLDTATVGHFNESVFKLFYVIDGEIHDVYNPNYDNPRNFKVYKHKNEYRIGIGMNYTESSEKPITYIQWNETDTDTIEAEYIRTDNAVMKNKVWFNGKLIWDRSLNQEEYYKIIK